MAIPVELATPGANAPLVAGSGNVADGAAVATLPGVAGKTTYITGFDITAAGATAAAVVLAAVAGLLAGAQSFVYAAPAGATVQGPTLSIRFPAPLPASAVNTAITVTLPALGAGNTNAAVVAYGFQL